MTPIVDEGMFIYFISNSETRRKLRDSLKIVIVEALKFRFLVRMLTRRNSNVPKEESNL